MEISKKRKYRKKIEDFSMLDEETAADASMNNNFVIRGKDLFCQIEVK